MSRRHVETRTLEQVSWRQMSNILGQDEGMQGNAVDSRLATLQPWLHTFSAGSPASLTPHRMLTSPGVIVEAARRVTKASGFASDVKRNASGSCFAASSGVQDKCELRITSRRSLPVRMSRSGCLVRVASPRLSAKTPRFLKKLASEEIDVCYNLQPIEPVSRPRHTALHLEAASAGPRCSRSQRASS